jgi:hypothetical protein
MILNDITKHLLTVYIPYLIAFLLGVIVAWKGCGDTSGKTITIEKPVATVEYVDRWQTDTVRFVSKRVVTKYDTIYKDRVVSRLDTMFLIDTVKIVEAWLTEVAKYDTTISSDAADIDLTWQNYQNRTEKFNVVYTPKKVALKWALGVHGNAGLISDFESDYKPLLGVGLQATIKKGYYGLDYGYNGKHYIGVRVGRNILTK